MKNFYRRAVIAILFLVTLGLFIYVLMSRTTASPLEYTPKGIYQQQITGVVTSQAGEPLLGVTIQVKNQLKGTTTNLDGEFKIIANPLDTLVFSFVGYHTLEIPVNGRSFIAVNLMEDITSLGEVEINAGYYNTTKRESTGSISRVTAEEIEKQPILDPLAAIQGRMPGVEITQTTGVPGGSFDIKIRGTNSLRSEGNQPLYIIDGVPYFSQRLSSLNLTGQITGEGSTPLSLINPGDIQSIEVLKDADATAIYGSRGANGVVLITTKQGRPGKVKLSLDASMGFGENASKIKLLNTRQYVSAREEAYANDGTLEYPYYAYDINGTWDRERYTDWQEELIGGTAENTNLRLNISGGNEQTSFLISGDYLKQTTVFPGDYHYDKGSGHFNLTHNSEDKKLLVQLSGTYTVDKNNQPAIDFTREALMLPPNAPQIYNEDGSLNWANSTWNNPLRNLEGMYSSSTNGLISNLVLNYELFKGLHLKSNFGYTTVDYDEISTNPSTTFDPAYGVTSASSTVLFNKASNHSWIIEPQITYEYTTDNHELQFLAGATFQEDGSDKFVQFAYGFASNELITNLAAATGVFIVDNSQSKYRYNAVFGRLNYKYLDRYILNLTGRRDGSSRFGPGKRFSNFGAVGGAWLFGEETIFDGSFINFGKLRASYGVTGNDQIGDYQYLDTYSVTQNSYNGIPGLSPSRLFNPDFSWESNRKLEFGLELQMFKNRLYTSVSFFRNRSSNQLVGIPLALTTGFSSIQANLKATVENRGWEFELRSQNVQNKNFSWSTSFNLTIPENKLIDFPGLESSTYASSYIVGEPLDIVKGYHYTGIDPQSGIYTFEDFNNDGKISAIDDRQAISRLNKDLYGGISNHLEYSRLSLDFFFQFAKQKGINAIYAQAYPMARVNQPSEVLDRWQEPGDMVKFQRFTSGANPNAVLAYSRFKSSDAIATNASFIRLKNLVISYVPHSEWLKGVDTRLYLQGQNLLTFTNYLGLDPETQSMSALPPLKIISAGINVSF